MGDGAADSTGAGLSGAGLDDDGIADAALDESIAGGATVSTVLAVLAADAAAG
jgi:hypothetical protein